MSEELKEQEVYNNNNSEGTAINTDDVTKTLNIYALSSHILEALAGVLFIFVGTNIFATVLGVIYVFQTGLIFALYRNDRYLDSVYNTESKFATTFSILVTLFLMYNILALGW